MLKMSRCLYPILTDFLSASVFQARPFSLEGLELIRKRVEVFNESLCISYPRKGGTV